MKRILCILLFFPVYLTAGENLLFKALTANQIEARIGSFYQLETDKLRLDIGASLDLLELNISKTDAAIGADFFTYTRLRAESNFKFPVETSDYYFGVNFSGKIPISDDALFFRFRLAHISSHLVDGYSQGNIFNQLPIIYSREFLELTVAKYFNSLRLYGGFNYLYSTKPKDPESLSAHAGFDYQRDLTNLLAFRGGYHFLMSGINGIYSGTNSAQAGIVIKLKQNYGIFIGAYYYNGRSIHGQFYKLGDTYTGIGIEFLY